MLTDTYIVSKFNSKGTGNTGKVLIPISSIQLSQVGSLKYPGFQYNCLNHSLLNVAII